MDASSLRQLARGNRALAAKLRKEAAEGIAAATTLERQADELDAAAGGTKELSHKREQSGNVSDVTRKHHALAIAKTAAKDDPFRLHITGKGLSQNKVAKRAGCSTAALSRYRDDRPCPTTIANRIQALTGWPADAEHWPAGLA